MEAEVEEDQILQSMQVEAGAQSGAEDYNDRKFDLGNEGDVVAAEAGDITSDFSSNKWMNSINDERIRRILQNTAMINSNEYFQLQIAICYLLPKMKYIVSYRL